MTETHSQNEKLASLLLLSFIPLMFLRFVDSFHRSRMFWGVGESGEKQAGSDMSDLAL